jgi:hypothetical protein
VEKMLGDGIEEVLEIHQPIKREQPKIPKLNI